MWGYEKSPKIFNCLQSKEVWVIYTQTKFIYCKCELVKCFIFSVTTTAICKKPLVTFSDSKNSDLSPHLKEGDFSINSQTFNLPQD